MSTRTWQLTATYKLQTHTEVAQRAVLAPNTVGSDRRRACDLAATRRNRFDIKPGINAVETIYYQ